VLLNLVIENAERKSFKNGLQGRFMLKHLAGVPGLRLALGVLTPQQTPQPFSAYPSIFPRTARRVSGKSILTLTLCREAPELAATALLVPACGNDGACGGALSGDGVVSKRRVLEHSVANGMSNRGQPFTPFFVSAQSKTRTSLDNPGLV